MKLYQYINSKVKIVTIENAEYFGVALDYTPAQDNDNEVASICIGDCELYEDEIKSIEIID